MTRDEAVELVSYYNTIYDATFALAVEHDAKGFQEIHHAYWLLERALGIPHEPYSNFCREYKLLFGVPNEVSNSKR